MTCLIDQLDSETAFANMTNSHRKPTQRSTDVSSIYIHKQFHNQEKFPSGIKACSITHGTPPTYMRIPPVRIKRYNPYHSISMTTVGNLCAEEDNIVPLYHGRGAREREKEKEKEK